jgi:protein-S-isoprenylcysteine O-methyltransferase Ste14
MNQHLHDDPRYQNHERRPDLAGEYPLGDTYQIIAFFIFLSAALLDFFFLGFSHQNNAFFSFWIRIPFIILLFSLGCWLSLHGIKVVFGDYRETPILITHDLFTYVRHPVYLGAILVYLAILILVLSPLAGIVWLGIIILYDWLAKYEEKLMLKEFGDAYREYQKKVPMWLPTFKHKR